MATIVKYVYNHTALKLLKLSMENEKHNFKFKLLNLSTPSAFFNPSHTLVSQVDNSGSNEVSGFGWPLGGFTLLNPSLEIFNINEACLKFANIYQLISGGILGPFTSGIIFIDENGLGTTLTPIIFIDYNETKTVSDGYPFQLVISETGLFRQNFIY